MDRKRPMYRYTTGAAGMLEQMKRAETIQAIWHRKLIEAGYEWDGMDGYTAPAGTDAGDMRRLLDEALNEASQERSHERQETDSHRAVRPHHAARHGLCEP